MNKETIASRGLFWGLMNLILVIVFVMGIKVLFFHTPLIEPEMTVTVSGEAKATIVPDVALINFSVVSEGPDPVKLQADNTTKMNQAIDFVKSQGVDAKDIKTTAYNLYPKYDYVKSDTVQTMIYPPYPGKQVISGYSFTQSVEVKVRDFKKITTLLGGLSEKGINQIDGPNFTVDDQDKYLNDARIAAFANARAKVEAMARANGVSVVRVVTFSEDQNGPIYYARAEALGKGGADTGSVPAPTIEPGSQDSTVTVSVTYAIR